VTNRCAFPSPLWSPSTCGLLLGEWDDLLRLRGELERIGRLLLQCHHVDHRRIRSTRFPPALDLLDATLSLVGVAVLPLLVSAAVLLPAFYLSAWLLAKRPQATRQPNSLNRLRSVLTANWLRTAWIGLAVLFFVMVVVPGALLIYHYSGIGD
jgi:hypothetical protein